MLEDIARRISSGNTEIWWRRSIDIQRDIAIVSFNTFIIGHDVQGIGLRVSGSNGSLPQPISLVWVVVSWIPCYVDALQTALFPG